MLVCLKLSTLIFTARFFILTNFGKNSNKVQDSLTSHLTQKKSHMGETIHVHNVECRN